MSPRRILLFLLGFVAGALSLYFVLWRTGGLATGHFLSLTTREIEHGEQSTPPSVLPTISPPMPTAPPTVVPVTGTHSPISALATPSLDSFSLNGSAIGMPVEGARRSDLHDSFEETRGTHRHEAIDILAARGTPVLAVVDGSIAKLFTSKQGGLTVYEFDRDAVYCYYYAHLDRYAEDLHDGQAIQRGNRIGYVGTTGDAPPDTPHLHFAIYRLGPEKHWWEGVAVNPYPTLLQAAGK